MSLYLRRLVSGKKARYRDDQLNLELDLAYVTDRIIVMGFPAVGVESIYRNHRADVQRFLSTRHGSNFWVFNFCPVRENTYHESVFEGRVSRYPFPDHHVPPFSYLSLVTREIHAWLAGSDARVAVLHCKAGKGRSGTLACAYLLSRCASPSTPIPGSFLDSLSDWSLIGDKEGLQTPSPGTSAALLSDRPSIRSASASFGADMSRISSEPAVNSLEMVLNLHTSRRMKPSRYHPDAHKRPKMGVSIPSQQRWLFYWSQVLAGKGPPSLRPCLTEGCAHEILRDKEAPIAAIKLTKLTIRMRESSRIQPHLVQAASVVITSAGKGRASVGSASGGLWACLARYSDRLVDELEHWENVSCGSDDVAQSSPFKDKQWDKAKMIQSFGQMTISDVQPVQQGEGGKPISAYVLRPHIEVAGGRVERRERSPDDRRQSTSPSESSYTFASHPTEEDSSAGVASSIALEANRELRIKLFMGEVALGWVWLIPAFHISPNSPTSSLVLSSDDVDFAIGIGKALVDIKISFARE